MAIWWLKWSYNRVEPRRTLYSCVEHVTIDDNFEDKNLQTWSPECFLNKVVQHINFLWFFFVLIKKLINGHFFLKGKHLNSTYGQIFYSYDIKMVENLIILYKFCILFFFSLDWYPTLGVSGQVFVYVHIMCTRLSIMCMTIERWNMEHTTSMSHRSIFQWPLHSVLHIFDSSI